MVKRWLTAGLSAILLVGCSLSIELPFRLPFAQPESTVAPVTIAPPPATATDTPESATTTMTLAPTATVITATGTLTPTLAATSTVEPTQTLSALAPEAKTLIAAHTATFVPPVATGRPTQPIQLPLESLPTRAPREAAPTFTAEIKDLIPGQGEVTDVTPVSATATSTASSVQIEWTWAQSVNGTTIEASGLARNLDARPVTLIRIDLAFRDAEGALLATAQAVAAPNSILTTGQQAAWSTYVANPGNVSSGEIVSLEWTWAD